MSITAQQAQLYMKARETGAHQPTAAAKAGISERTGRRLEYAGLRPSRPHDWRTRADAFSGVWDDIVLPLLTQTPSLGALSLLEHLQTTHPAQYPDALLRTLQRRVKNWRALHGPSKDIIFRQQPVPGQQGLSDFTEFKDIVITINQIPFIHKLYHFRLAYSGWSHMRVVQGGESYTALATGLQSALERLAGSPAEHRTDSLSAAYRNLDQHEADDVTQLYEALCEHYSMIPTRNNRGVSHENGAIESPHGHIKRRLRDALAIRGSLDFSSIDEYQKFVDDVVCKHNQRCCTALEQEKACLQPLPAIKAITYTQIYCRVTTSSVISVRLGLYTVPSRLIGERLRVHLYDQYLECYIGNTLAITLPRVYASAGKRRFRCIDYRHIIHSLCKKPMAFYRSQMRDDILPNGQWRELWRSLDASLSPSGACRLIVGALKLAADYNCEDSMANFLEKSLCEKNIPTVLALQEQFGKPPQASVSTNASNQHDLASYDDLLNAMHVSSTSVEAAHA